MANLNVAALNAPFTTDPRIQIMNFIKSNYGNGNITGLPDKDLQVGFDTKFSKLSKKNYVIVEKMPDLIRPAQLGNSRNTHNQKFRVQIYCTTRGAINNKYLMEQEIERIIQTNPTGLLSTGIEELSIESFTEIAVSSDSLPSQGEAQMEVETLARSSAIITARYDKVVN